MDRVRSCWFLCLAFVLASASMAMAQPKLIITPLSQDLSNDGNTVVGTILDENVYAKLTTFTRGSGFQFWGPVLRGADGGIQMSDITAGNFFLETGLYNGFNGSTPWPQSNPGLFGNYVGTRPCCNGTTCTVMDASQCLGPNYSVLNTASCSPNPCPSTPPVSGGCCNATTGVCTYITQAACGAPNYWIGGFQACGNFPCSHGHNLPFRFSSATNAWTNAGSIPNNTGGVGLGASKCDGGIATPYGISSNGRYIVGGSWYGSFGQTGCATRGFVYDNNDSSVQMLPLIATAAGCQNFNQAWAVSTDGMIVLGRDTHASTSPGPGGTLISCNATCLTVWDRDLTTGQFLLPRTARACCNGSACTVVDPALCAAGSVALASTSCSPNPCPPSPNPPSSGACCNSQSMNCSATPQSQCVAPNFWIGAAACSPHNPCLPSTETVLDEYGAGGLKESVMTRSGSVIAATISSGKADYVLLDSSKFGDLTKYVKNTGTGGWDMVQIGKVAGSVAGGQGNRNMIPYAISDDGNTIVGAYNGGSFIWRPTINGGVPMDFAAYLQSINGGQPFPPTGGLGLGQSMSADGSVMLASWFPPGPAACSGSGGLSDLSRPAILYLNGSSVPCQPPVIAGGPYDKVQVEYTIFGIVGNVFVAGSYPMTMQWQKETSPGSNVWANIADSCGTFTPDAAWTYEGTSGFQLRINMLADASARDGRFRVIATNECGSATSDIATIGVTAGACCYYSTNSGTTVCSVELPSRCTGSTAISYFFGGVYQGDGTTCTPTACDSAIGACCYYSGSVQCVLDVTTHCTLAVASGGRGGTFVGGATTCSPTICDTVSGACCYSPDGLSSVTCTVELSSRCSQAVSIGGVAGVYAGNAIACSAGPSCPPGTPGIGACCFNATLLNDIACSIQASAHCSGSYSSGGLQGKYQGDGSTCTTSICRPSTFGLGSGLGACCFTDPANISSGSICVITTTANCQNYPNGSNDGNTAPFTLGVGGNFYPNTCCQAANPPPVSSCNTTANCAITEGACISTPFDNSSGIICTVQVRASRCTRRYNAGGLFGAWIPSGVCSPALIAANSGACCNQPLNGLGEPIGCPVCTIQTQDRCITVNNGGMSGVYGGHGTTCTPVAQCPAQYGACCNGNNCTVLGRSACIGTFYGLNSVTCTNVGCSTITAQPPPTGACCNTTTTACTMTTQAACTSPNSWIYTGTCAPTNSCGQPGSGACCLFGNSCILTCPSDCALNVGTYIGDSTSCTPDPCAPAGVCCRGATCGTTTSAACTVASGMAGATFVGAGTCGPSATSPCCHANYNKVGGISVQDIFDFLGDWFASSPYANTGGNGTPGPLSVQNIFDFLGAWFAGGC